VSDSLKSLSFAGPALCLLLGFCCGGCGDESVDPNGPATLGATLEHPAARESWGDARGVVLLFLVEGGPAAEAGLQAGDVVQAIDGSRVVDLCGLESALANRRPGEDVKLTVLRGAELLEETVKLANFQELYESACADGQAEACHRLGIFYEGKDEEVGLLVSQRAAEIFEQACKGGSAGGCTRWGMALRGEDGTQARKLFRQACKDGSAAGCMELAQDYATDVQGLQDDARAFSLFQQACAGGDGTGCFRLGLQFEHGQGTARNLIGASTAYEKACKLGNFEGCTQLGSLYEKGLGVPADMARATAFYGRSCGGNLCELGDPTACHNLGEIYRDGRGVPVDKAGAAAYFEQSCRWNVGWSCADLADLVFAGDGVPKDEKRAAELFRRACEGGHSVSCRNADARPEDVMGRGEAAPAADRLDITCRGGSMAACHQLAELYDDGWGVPQDDVRAATLYEKACLGGEAPACLPHGMPLAGSGAPEDRERGLELIRRACDAGVEKACA
jgi:uncharacterized protein